MKDQEARQRVCRWCAQDIFMDNPLAMIVLNGRDSGSPNWKHRARSDNVAERIVCPAGPEGLHEPVARESQ